MQQLIIFAIDVRIDRNENRTFLITLRFSPGSPLDVETITMKIFVGIDRLVVISSQSAGSPDGSSLTDTDLLKTCLARARV